MKFESLIQELKDKNKVYTEANIDLENTYHKAENLFSKEFAESWGKCFSVPPKFYISSGYAARDYKPGISVYGINNFAISFRSDGVFCDTLDERKVVELEGISVQMIEDFAKKFEQDTGLPVEVVKKEIRTKESIRGIRSADELEIFYADENIKVVGEGQIWYMGWDIPDVYFIFTLNNEKKLRIIYSDDGHGGGADVQIDPGDEAKLDSFVCMLRESDNQEALRVENQVLESWES